MPRFHFNKTIVAAILLMGCLGGISYGEEKEFKPERWEKDIQAFEEKDRIDPPPQNAVLFVGSSSIRLWDLKKSFPDLKTINRGFGGSHLSDSLFYADRIVLPYKPKIVVLYAGDNDLNDGKTPNQVFVDYCNFVRKVLAALPQTKIIYIPVKPSIKRWALKDKIFQLNNLVIGFNHQDERLLYADIYTPMLGKDGNPRPELFVEDNLHINDEGYKLWTSILQPYLAPTKKK